MKLFFLLTAIFFTQISVFASASNVFDENTQDIQNTRSFLVDMLKRANGVAKDAVHQFSERGKFADIVTNSFALKSIAKFALGPNFHNLTEEEFSVFSDLLAEYFTKTYATKEKVELFASVDLDAKNLQEGYEMSPRKNRVTFKGVFQTKSGPTKVEFILLKTGLQKYNIFDIKIEGIGLLSNLRSDLKAMWKEGLGSEQFLSNFRNLIQNKS